MRTYTAAHSAGNTLNIDGATNTEKNAITPKLEAINSWLITVHPDELDARAAPRFICAYST